MSSGNGSIELGQGALVDEGLENDNGSAPRYTIPPKTLAAVEIPAVVNNVDRAISAFGRVPSLEHALEPERNSIPLYLNPESPYCKPLMSHNTRTHNVVLQVTVPKRTGRKRKRGSSEPWQGDLDMPDDSGQADTDKVQSRARLDEPQILRKKLEDNVGKYEVEAIGIIKHTHRFRGLADFYWDMNKSDFAQRYVNQALSGDVQTIKQFNFNPGVDTGPNVDVIPPPVFTHMSLPFNYFYSQNPYVRVTEDGNTFNATATKNVGYFIGAEDETPTEPQQQPDMTDPRTVEIIAELEEAFKERPLWTRRSLMNRLSAKLRNWNELKKYLNYAAYQFKGGPWRDSVVPYGLDPRNDPKYRIYQTVLFKLRPRHNANGEKITWRAPPEPELGRDELKSHIFDGETYHTDGKVWQVCDITDPLLRDLLQKAAVRPTRHHTTGWYHGGLWAKVKGIMKTKLVAIQFGRHLTHYDFARTLEAGDETPVRTANTGFSLSLPNLNLTNEELTMLRGREPYKRKRQSYMVRVKDTPRRDDQVSEQPSGSGAQDGAQDMDDSEDLDSENDEESGSGSENESIDEEP